LGFIGGYGAAKIFSGALRKGAVEVGELESKVLDDGLKLAEKGGDTLQGGRRLPKDKILKPPSKRGNAPIGEDGAPVELHHRNQTMDGPIDEMVRRDHRGRGNYKRNHPSKGKSKIDRKEAAKQRRKHWENEWDQGRWKDYIEN